MKNCWLNVPLALFTRPLVYSAGAWALLGLVIGITASLLLMKYLESQLYGVKARDPLTFIGVAAGLALVALAACYFPARRATKVDPLVALRYE